MLFGKRERFERTDVPRESPYSNVIGVIVIVVVFAALGIVVSNVVARVGKETRLGDIDLSRAVGDQSSMVVTDEQYSISQDTFTKILFLTVADASDAEAGTTVSAAQALMIRETAVADEGGEGEEGDEGDAAAEDGSEEGGAATQATATLANLPLEAKVTSGETSATLADFMASQGAAATVVPLSTAANIKFSHVVLSSGDALGQIVALAGTDPNALLDTATDFVEQTRTDMTAEEVVALAGLITRVGVENIVPVDAPLVAETTQAEDGSQQETGFQVIDRTALCVAVGTLV